MKLLLTRWFGSVVLEDGRVVARRDFPPNAHAVAERLARVVRGEILDEERALAGPGVAVTEDRLKSLGPVRAPEKPPTVDSGGRDAALLREAALLVARDALRRSTAERDRFLVQSVRALDEIHRTGNTLMERLRDWYALHFPETIRRIGDPAAFAQLLADAPDRESVARALGALTPEDSIGAPFTSVHLQSVKGFAESISALFAQRKQLEALIEAEAREVVPTLAGLVGPLIAARLVSHANGLERLAGFPASTVQTLGAENALFLHLKEDKKPPKHGVLFQHPLVNTAPRWQRGRIARLLATHASLAARMDRYGAEHTDRSGPLKERLERRLKGLRARPAPRRRNGARPPPRRVRPAPRPRGGRRG